MTEAVEISLIHDTCLLLGGIAATMGVAWISSRAPKKMLEKQDHLEEKVDQVHKLTNDSSEKALAKIDALTAEVAQLKAAAAWRDGFAAASEATDAQSPHTAVEGK